jgi:hypothetical protein
VISRRRALLAIAAFLAGPSGTVWLAAHHRPVGALMLGGLLLLYGVAELVAFEVRDHAAAAAHLRYEREAAGPIRIVHGMALRGEL